MQAEVRDKPFQLGVLPLELAQPLHLRRHQPSIALAPVVERRLPYPSLAGHLANRPAILSLLQGKSDLCVRKLQCLHGTLEFPVERSQLENSSHERFDLAGERHKASSRQLTARAIAMAT